MRHWSKYSDHDYLKTHFHIFLIHAPGLKIPLRQLCPPESLYIYDKEWKKSKQLLRDLVLTSLPSKVYHDSCLIGKYIFHEVQQPVDNIGPHARAHSRFKHGRELWNQRKKHSFYCLCWRVLAFCFVPVVFCSSTLHCIIYICNLPSLLGINTLPQCWKQCYITELLTEYSEIMDSAYNCYY